MEEPMLKSIELTDRSKIVDVRRNHVKLMENGHDTSVKTRELIDILGGMDHVLSNYLSENNPYTLSTQQIQQINRIFLTIPDKTVSYENNSVLSLSKKDTFLHQIFSESKSDKIMMTIFGKRMTCLYAIIIVLVLLGLTSFSYMQKYYTLVFIFYLIVITVLMIMVILFLLSLNKTATKLIVSTFEFWFKLIYLIRFFVCVLIMNFRDSNWNLLKAINIIVFIFSWLLAFLLYSLIDGLQVPLRFKIVVMIGVSIVMSWYAVRSTVWAIEQRKLDENDQEMLYLFSKSVAVNLVVVGAESIRVVTLFAWKQTVKALYYRNIAVSVNKPVSIEWIDPIRNEYNL